MAIDTSKTLAAVSYNGVSIPFPEPPVEKDVNFYDYDGTLVDSYTAEGFLALDALPANPTHDGLTAQGWNWTLADAKAQVQSAGKCDIGQMYITSDGKTRVYIELEEGGLSPYLYLFIDGSADIDWGDGTEHSTLTGTFMSPLKYIKHIYASKGEYVISITVTGSAQIKSTSSTYSLLISKGANFSSVDYTYGYSSSIKKIEVGNNITEIGLGGLAGCTNLTTITIPSGVPADQQAFQHCHSLKSIIIPNSISFLPMMGFSDCYSLEKIVLSNTITSIGQLAFYNCRSLKKIAIPNNVTSMGENTFSGCSSLKSVVISSGLASIKCFNGCTSLSDIKIINDNTARLLFRECTSLRNISLSNTQTYIDLYCFYKCYSLANITIPSSVTSIESNAFASCYGLGYIKFMGSTPPTASAANWYVGVPTDCKILVPTGSLSAYTSAANYPSSSTYTYEEY